MNAKTCTPNAQTRQDASLSPAADVYETPEGVSLFLDVPGVDEASLEVRFEDDLLAIRGTARLGEGRERTYARSFRLGDELDPEGIEAVLDGGVLRIDVGKKRSTARKIEIRSGTSRE